MNYQPKGYMSTGDAEILTDEKTVYGVSLAWVEFCKVKLKSDPLVIFFYEAGNTISHGQNVQSS